MYQHITLRAHDNLGSWSCKLMSCGWEISCSVMDIYILLYIQSALVILSSIISKNCLSRRENLVLV